MDNRIGAQFFTIRDYTKTIEDFEESCKKVSKMGYKTVQISAVPLDAKEIRPILDKYGLSVVTTHRSFDDFVNDIDGIIEYNKTLGCDICGVGMMPTSYAEDNAKVSDFISKANKACETLKKEGLYFGYHNHAFEFVKLDGKTIFDRLVEETDQETFNFIADVFWFQVGGKTPQDMIKQLGGRAMSVHFKDFAVKADEWRAPQFAEVGRGNLDWDKIIKACEEAGTRWALVEQDSNWATENPFDSLEESYKFLTTKGFC